MFLPGVSLRIKLFGAVVLAVLIFSVVGTGLEAVQLVLADGNGQGQIASSLSSQAFNDEDHAVVGGLKFVCPFH